MAVISSFIYPISVPIVTSLPSTATIGDQRIYVADSSNGVYWNLVYDGSGTYPWKFVGGAGMVNEVVGAQATSSASYAQLSGPQLTIPLAGYYDVAAGCHIGSAAGGAAGMGVANGVAAASASDWVWALTQAPGYSTSGSRSFRTLISSAGTVLLSAIKAPQSISVTFMSRSLSATPIRVAAA